MKKLLMPALLVGILAASGCAALNTPVVEQEEEISGKTAAQGKYSVDPRWELGNWDIDYASGD